MEIINDTPFAHGLSVGLGPHGDTYLAVILKATFTLPKAPDGRPEVAPEQQPVATADETYTKGAPGSLRQEKDTAPFKPRADVALIGTAYAPGGQAVRTLDVMLRVGRLRKVLRVFGDREWIFPTRMVMVPLISEPQPFRQMPLTYAGAFGGIDRKAGRCCTSNYGGKGFLGEKTRESVNQRPLPNIEDPARLIASWDDEPLPAGFGFYPAHCQPRLAHAGTEQGAAQAHPVFGLAADFRHDFFNAAHPDLQVAGYLQGDEEVELVHLTPDGRRRFRLPGVRPALTFTPAAAEPTPLEARLDTLAFLPDEGLFYQVWRGVYPLGAVTTPAALHEALAQVQKIRFSLPAGPSVRASAFVGAGRRV